MPHQLIPKMHGMAADNFESVLDFSFEWHYGKVPSVFGGKNFLLGDGLCGILFHFAMYIFASVFCNYSARYFRQINPNT